MTNELKEKEDNRINFYSKLLEQREIVNSYTDVLNMISDFCKDLCSENMALKSKAESVWECLYLQYISDPVYRSYVNTFVVNEMGTDLGFIQYNVYALKQITCMSQDNEEMLMETLFRTSQIKMLVRALRENSKNIPEEICFKFIHYRIIPEICAPKNPPCVQDILEMIRYVLSTPPGFAYKFMSTEIIHKFKDKIKNVYIPEIKTQPHDGLHWWLQINMLIHYSGRLLHKHFDITNIILRLLESGFKTKTVQDRMGSFDCWKSLIKNYSLDLEYFRHVKQILLLIKPLKVQLSRNSLIAVKRFEVYAYFIELVQNYSDTCVEDFLTFCFAPAVDELGDKHDICPGRQIVEIMPKCTEILLKLLGHKIDRCCKNAYLTDIYSIKAFLTSENFHKYVDIFIGCVRVCSNATTQWATANDQQTVIKCLWNSVYDLLRDVKDTDHRNEILVVIVRNITTLLKKCDIDENYFDSVVKDVLKSTVSYVSSSDCKDISFKDILILPLIAKLCSHQAANPKSIPNTVYKDIVDDLLDFCRESPDTFLEIINKLFEENRSHCNLLNEILFYIIRSLPLTINYAQTKPLKYQDIISNLLLYSINHSVDESFHYWNLTEKKMLTVTSNMKMFLLKKVKAALLENPTTSRMVLKAVIVLVDLVMLNDQVYFTEIVSVLSNCCSLLKINKQDSRDYIRTLRKVVEGRKIFDFEVDEGIFKCFEELLKIDSHTCDVLLELNTFLNSLTLAERKKGDNKILINILSDLSAHSNVKITKEAVRNLAMMDMTKVRISTPTMMSRGALISTMAKTSPTPTESPRSDLLRLFGQEVSTPSKIRVKGSYLEATKSPNSNAKSPKAANAMPSFTKKSINLDNFKETDFVPIAKEVCVDVNQLNEHQKEVIKKKREDIPALYQDLSQSISLSHIVDFATKIKQKMSPDDNTKNKTRKHNSELQVKSDKNIEEKKKFKNGDQINNVNMKKRGRPVGSKAKLSINKNTSRSRRVVRKKQKEEGVANKIQKGGAAKEIVKGGAAREIQKLKMDIVDAESFKEVGPRKRVSKHLSYNEYEIGPLAVKKNRRKSLNDNEFGNNENGKSKISNFIDNLENQINKILPETDNMNIENKVQIEQIKRDNVLSATGIENGVLSINLSSKQVKVKKSTNFEFWHCNSLFKNCGVTESESIIRNSPSTLSSPENQQKIDYSTVRVSLFRFDKKGDKPDKDIDSILDPKKSAVSIPSSKKSESSPIKASSPTKSIVIENSEIEISQLPTPPHLKPLADTDTLELCTSITKPTSELETESIIGDSSINLALTPKSDFNGSTVIGSPETSDTPTRKSELFNDTLFISPIKKSKEDTIINEPSPDIFNSENALDKNFIIVETEKTSEDAITLKSPSFRSAKLLNNLPQNCPKGIVKKNHKAVIESSKPVNSSPKTDRIRKMMLNCEEKNEPEIINIDDEEVTAITNTNILKFDREIPSPFAKPKISILKRKMPDIPEDGFSPSAKRKRVNFSDPPISCEKIYFKEQDENSHFLRKSKKKLLNMNPLIQSDTRDSIQSMQTQIENLTNGGFAPLPSSPTKDDDSAKSSVNVLSNVLIRDESGNDVDCIHIDLTQNQASETNDLTTIIDVEEDNPNCQNETKLPKTEDNKKESSEDFRIAENILKIVLKSNSAYRDFIDWQIKKKQSNEQNKK